MDKQGEIILYQPDETIRLEVKLEDETVWLTLNQIAYLFNRDKSVISRHINNIFKEKELECRATVAKYATVQNENGRIVERQIEYYNLDVIISVGYRIKSFICISPVSPKFHMIIAPFANNTFQIICCRFRIII